MLTVEELSSSLFLDHAIFAYVSVFFVLFYYFVCFFTCAKHLQSLMMLSSKLRVVFETIQCILRTIMVSCHETVFIIDSLVSFEDAYWSLYS